MRLRNKTNKTIPIDGTKCRGYRMIDVDDELDYDKKYFEEIDIDKITTNTKVVYDKKVNSTKRKSKEE